MTTLRFNKLRLCGLIMMGSALAAGSTDLAFHPPVPHGRGLYSVFYHLLGPGPGSAYLLFGGGALFFVLCGLVHGSHLLADGIAAEITVGGLSVRRYFSRVDVPWGDVRSFERKQTRTRTQTFRFIHIHRLSGGKLTIAQSNLDASDAEVDRWVDEAVNAWRRYRATPAQPRAVSSGTALPRGFGRRTLPLRS